MYAGVMERIVQRTSSPLSPSTSRMVLVLINNTVAILPVALLLHKGTTTCTLKWQDPEGGLVDRVHGSPSVRRRRLHRLGGRERAVRDGHLVQVVGNVNKFIVIAVGMLAMGESSSWEAIVGCVIAISGGFSTRCRIVSTTRRAEEKARPRRRKGPA